MYYIFTAKDLYKLPYSLFFYTWLSLYPFTGPQAHSSKIAADRFFIENIDIVTANETRLDAQEIKKIKKIANIPIQATLFNSQASLKKASNRLFSKGYIADIQPIPSEKNPQTCKIRIRILEKLNKIKSIHWKGLKKSEKEKVIDLIPCKESKFLLSYHIKKSVTLIKNYFKKQGCPHVQVHLKQTSSDKGQTKIYFTIKKRNKVYVNQVTFQGNHHLESEALVKTMPYTKQRIKNVQHLVRELFTWSVGLEIIGHVVRFFKGTPFIQETLEQELALIKRYYHARGFIDVSITYKVTYPKKSYANITLSIIEGAQYKLGQIIWKGNEICKDHELSKFLDLQPGDIFNFVELQKKIYGHAQHKGMQKLYETKNYDLASIDIKMNKSVHEQINLAIDLQETPQLIIDEIIIQKDLPINFNFKRILKQNGLQKGKIITATKLAKARNSLIYTGTVEAEKIEFITQPTTAGKANLVCKIDIKRPAFKVFEIGFENLYGTANIGVDHIDLKKWLQGKKLCMGTQKVSLQAAFNVKKLINLQIADLFSDRKNKFTLSFEDVINPEIMNPFLNPIKISIDGGIAHNKKEDQNEFTKGIRLLMASQWKRDTSVDELRAALSYYTTDAEKIKLTEHNNFNGNVKQLACTIGYKMHTLNDLLYPTQGSNWNTTCTLAMNRSSEACLHTSYAQLVSTYIKYLDTEPILGQFVVKWQVAGGILMHTNNQTPVGKFLLGLPDTEYLDSLLDRHYVHLRGYQSKYIPIQDASNANYLGGSYFISQNVELRYALNKTADSYGLLFLDMAYARQSLQNPLAANGGISLGVGFRTKTPFGFVLGFDLAWPLTDENPSMVPKFILSFGIES